MRFLNLEVLNLRAVERFAVSDLGDFVMVAGQNGSGKSCVFDAVRLLKSFYGGYQADEHMHWFTEFDINVQDRGALRRMFRDISRPIVVSAQVSLADSEAEYLRSNVRDLAWPVAWQRVTGQKLDPWTFSRISIAAQIQQFQEPIEKALDSIQASVEPVSSAIPLDLRLEIHADSKFRIVPSAAAEVIFQAYRPDYLGIIEYHSASRAYSRQPLGGITLDTKQFADVRRQSTLYNWQNKYQNIKTELAAAYVRNLIAEASGQVVERSDAEDLNRTLQKLFQTFFPDKEYLGVRARPEGSLEFPVRLLTGESHDIDDLSSGEKEIVYGYLRLRNSTPRNSVVLLDEPELHLNPSLLQGFTDFYYNHLGVAQGNQLWLVTHSDTLLRQSVGNAKYRVYHMVPATSLAGSDNQAVEVLLDDDVERVMVDLVGDLASYRPHAKVVILEGDDESECDVNIVRRLFPDFARRVNLVSGGSKRRVRDLYSVLAAAVERTGIRNRFFAIVDRDSDEIPENGPREFAWDVYHIENYLLDIGSVRAAVASLMGGDRFSADEDVQQVLRDCAGLVIDRLVLAQVQDQINREFIGAINIGGSPDAGAMEVDLRRSVEGSAGRVSALANELSVENIQERSEAVRATLSAALDDGTWASRFPARLVLHRFAEKAVGGVKYETLVNVILDKMVERQVAPAGMRSVLDQIMAA